MRVRRPVALFATLLVVLAGAPAAAGSAGTKGAGNADNRSRVAAAAAPTLQVSTVLAGLAIPWDLTFTPNDTMLFTVRSGSTAGVYVRHLGGYVRRLAVPRGFYSSRALGMMGIVVDPRFVSNRRFYTCHGFASGTYKDIRVVPWTVNRQYNTVTELSPIVTGIPVTTGEQSGCRLRFDPQNRLYIGTGDAGIGTSPQDRASLGGKVLRVDPFTGAGVAGNPFITSSNARTRKIFTYGHRNVQGLTLRPGTSQMWSVEHGTDRDDEVNALLAGGNYGWDPVPGYNETVPMTDTTKFPNAVPARWSSGFPTIATSGGIFLSGTQWGSWNGAIAVANLKGSHLRVFRLDSAGHVVGYDVPAELNGTYGRLRTAQTGPGGALYLTTSNGTNDRILRVVPTTG